MRFNSNYATFNHRFHMGPDMFWMFRMLLLDAVAETKNFISVYDYVAEANGEKVDAKTGLEKLKILYNAYLTQISSIDNRDDVEKFCQNAVVEKILDDHNRVLCEINEELKDIEEARQNQENDNIVEQLNARNLSIDNSAGVGEDNKWMQH